MIGLLLYIVKTLAVEIWRMCNEKYVLFKCYAMPCYAMLYYAITSYALPCYAKLCYAMPSYAMPSYAILYFVNFSVVRH